MRQTSPRDRFPPAAILTFASRRLGFSRADEITIVFCGPKKNPAIGVPIATLLFAGHVGLVILPVMVCQQIQLMVRASLARRYAARRPPAGPTIAAGLKLTSARRDPALPSHPSAVPS